MQALIDVTIPVFGIMLAGYLCGRLGLLGQDSTAALNGFVYYVALPALFIVATAQAPFAELLDGPFLLAFLGAQGVTLLLAAVLARLFFTRTLGESGMHGICAVFSNTGYMGIPLLITAFGPEAAVPAIILSLCTGTVIFALATVVLEVDRGRRADGADRPSGPAIVAKALANALKTPLMVGAAIGVTLSAFEVALPVPVATFLDLLGAAAGPCALFAMGLFLVNQSVTRGALEVGWLSTVKLVLHPLVGWWLAAVVLDLPPHQIAYVVIMSALPVGSLMFLVAERYGVFVQRAAASILISTVVSVATVSVVLELYLT